jgi:predicted mannosyl-3-phosphoglycerate phosphatase (HAD superfamily)
MIRRSLTPTMTSTARRLHDLHAFEQAAELLRRVKREGLTVVLATSASERDATFLRAAIVQA